MSTLTILSIVSSITKWLCGDSCLILALFIPISYLIASMGLQILWSFGLACLDLHALRMKKSLRNSVLLCLFAIGDWVSISVNIIFMFLIS